MALGLLLTNPRVEVKTFGFWRDLLSEFVVTALLLFFANACGSRLREEDFVPLLQQALNNGLTVFVNIEAFGVFGGCHMNPAITLLFLCTKQMSPLKGRITRRLSNSLERLSIVFPVFFVAFVYEKRCISHFFQPYVSWSFNAVVLGQALASFHCKYDSPPVSRHVTSFVSLVSDETTP